ncbi:galectin-9B-like [Myotis daubentonii]|uniref:galectin-9B-like n=1 Tax=Myotis daubentonii TaxID=98922 RepID=UPI0028730C50|nr:galectin-9B-like [Myotis daubentonii]XP_059525438.1 galectin-9B-like [Myotis daubentonii]
MALTCNQLSVVNPVVPFSRATPGGLQYGHQVTVKGVFLPSCGSRFAVDFQTGFSDNDIAFHFNPRFEEGGYVVCNTRQKGRWGPEERMMINPFQMGIPFEISFLVENSGFQVKVNGNFFMIYVHRVPFHRVDTISFTGGVEVTEISIEDTRAVCLQRKISEVQSYPSPCGSPESKEQKPKAPGSNKAPTPQLDVQNPPQPCPAHLPASHLTHEDPPSASTAHSRLLLATTLLHLLSWCPKYPLPPHPASP